VYKIYIVRNTVNGKIYVGLTGKTVAKRWRAHVANSQKKNPSQYLARAIRKHGATNFTVRQIDKCDTRQTACGLEMAYILLYQATNPELGYNCTLGGDGINGVTFNHTEDAKEKISKALKGVPKPAGFGKKVSAGKTGRKLSARGCRNISEAHKGKLAPNRRTDVSDENVAAMYKAGKSKAEISRHFRISDATVGRRLAAAGLVTGYKKKAKWWMTQIS